MGLAWSCGWHRSVAAFVEGRDHRPGSLDLGLPEKSGAQLPKPKQVVSFCSASGQAASHQKSSWFRFDLATVPWFSPCVVLPTTSASGTRWCKLVEHIAGRKAAAASIYIC